MELSRQIEISLGVKNTLTFENKSSKIVMLNSGHAVGKNEPYSIRAGESLYVMFLPTEIEIELKIRKVRKKV